MYNIQLKGNTICYSGADAIGDYGYGQVRSTFRTSGDCFDAGYLTLRIGNDSVVIETDNCYTKDNINWCKLEEYVNVKTVAIFFLIVLMSVATIVGVFKLARYLLAFRESKLRGDRDKVVIDTVTRMEAKLDAKTKYQPVTNEDSGTDEDEIIFERDGDLADAKDTNDGKILPPGHIIPTRPKRVKRTRGINGTSLLKPALLCLFLPLVFGADFDYLYNVMSDQFPPTPLLEQKFAKVYSTFSYQLPIVYTCSGTPIDCIFKDSTYIYAAAVCYTGYASVDQFYVRSPVLNTKSVVVGNVTYAVTSVHCTGVNCTLGIALSDSGCMPTTFQAAATMNTVHHGPPINPAHNEPGTIALFNQIYVPSGDYSVPVTRVYCFEMIQQNYVTDTCVINKDFAYQYFYTILEQHKLLYITADFEYLGGPGLCDGFPTQPRTVLTIRRVYFPPTHSTYCVTNVGFTKGNTFANLTASAVNKTVIDYIRESPPYCNSSVFMWDGSLIDSSYNPNDTVHAIGQHDGYRTIIEIKYNRECTYVIYFARAPVITPYPAVRYGQFGVCLSYRPPGDPWTYTITFEDANDPPVYWAGNLLRFNFGIYYPDVWMFVENKDWCDGIYEQRQVIGNDGVNSIYVLMSTKMFTVCDSYKHEIIGCVCEGIGCQFLGVSGPITNVQVYYTNASYYLFNYTAMYGLCEHDDTAGCFTNEDLAEFAHIVYYDSPYSNYSDGVTVQDSVDLCIGYTNSLDYIKCDDYGLYLAIIISIVIGIVIVLGTIIGLTVVYKKGGVKMYKWRTDRCCVRKKPSNIGKKAPAVGNTSANKTVKYSTVAYHALTILCFCTVVDAQSIKLDPLLLYNTTYGQAHYMAVTGKTLKDAPPYPPKLDPLNFQDVLGTGTFTMLTYDETCTGVDCECEITGSISVTYIQIGQAFSVRYKCVNREKYFKVFVADIRVEYYSEYIYSTSDFVWESESDYDCEGNCENRPCSRGDHPGVPYYESYKEKIADGTVTTCCNWFNRGCAWSCTWAELVHTKTMHVFRLKPYKIVPLLCLETEEYTKCFYDNGPFISVIPTFQESFVVGTYLGYKGAYLNPGGSRLLLFYDSLEPRWGFPGDVQFIGYDWQGVPNKPYKFAPSGGVTYYGWQHSGCAAPGLAAHNKHWVHSTKVASALVHAESRKHYPDFSYNKENLRLRTAGLNFTKLSSGAFVPRLDVSFSYSGPPLPGVISFNGKFGIHGVEYLEQNLQLVRLYGCTVSPGDYVSSTCSLEVNWLRNEYGFQLSLLVHQANMKTAEILIVTPIQSIYDIRIYSPEQVTSVTISVYFNGNYVTELYTEDVLSFEKPPPFISEIISSTNTGKPNSSSYKVAGLTLSTTLIIIIVIIIVLVCFCCGKGGAGPSGSFAMSICPDAGGSFTKLFNDPQIKAAAIKTTDNLSTSKSKDSAFSALAQNPALSALV